MRSIDPHQDKVSYYQKKEGNQRRINIVWMGRVDGKNVRKVEIKYGKHNLEDVRRGSI